MERKTKKVYPPGREKDFRMGWDQKKKEDMSVGIIKILEVTLKIRGSFELMAL